MEWSAELCRLPWASEVIRHTKIFCHARHSVEVTCSPTQLLRDTVHNFMSVLDTALGDQGKLVLQLCWPHVLASLLMVMMVKEPIKNFEGLTQQNLTDALEPPLDASPLWRFSWLFAEAFRAARLPVGTDGFDLQPVGLPFFSTSRSLVNFALFHAHFTSLEHGSCAASRLTKSRHRGTFSLDSSTSGLPCAFSSSDGDLLERCRMRRQFNAAAKLNRTRPKSLHCPESEEKLLVVSALNGDAANGILVDVKWNMSVSPWIGRNVTLDLAPLWESIRFADGRDAMELPVMQLLQLPWSDSGRHGPISFKCSEKATVAVALRCTHPRCGPVDRELQRLNLEWASGTSRISKFDWSAAFHLSDGTNIHLGRSFILPGEEYHMPEGMGQVVVLIMSDDYDIVWMQSRWAKYGSRWCEPNYGDGSLYGWLTSSGMRSEHRCTFHSSMAWIDPPVGGWFLDWGSACGHKLVWAKQFYGLQVVGVEYQRESVEWARRHAPSLDLLCHGDGRYLSWLPDNFFDGALAFGSTIYLALEDQCSTVMQIVQKLRRGARAVIGFNAPQVNKWDPGMRHRNPPHMVLPYDAWLECFQGQGEFSRLGGLPADVQLEHRIDHEFFWYMSDQKSTAALTFYASMDSYALRLTRL